MFSWDSLYNAKMTYMILSDLNVGKVIYCDPFGFWGTLQILYEMLKGTLWYHRIRMSVKWFIATPFGLWGTLRILYKILKGRMRYHRTRMSVKWVCFVIKRSLTLQIYLKTRWLRIYRDSNASPSCSSGPPLKPPWFLWDGNASPSCSSGAL